MNTPAIRIVCPQEGLAHEFATVEAAVAALRDPTGPINFLEPGERHDLIRTLEAIAKPALSSSTKPNLRVVEPTLGANYVHSLDAAALNAQPQALKDANEEHGPKAWQPAPLTSELGEVVAHFAAGIREELDALEHLARTFEEIEEEDKTDPRATLVAIALACSGVGPRIGAHLEALRKTCQMATIRATTL